MSKSVKHLVMLAMFTTMALTIFVVEAQIPIPVPIYGVKLGLANVITLIVLVVYRPRERRRTGHAHSAGVAVHRNTGFHDLFPQRRYPLLSGNGTAVQAAAPETSLVHQHDRRCAAQCGTDCCGNCSDAVGAGHCLFPVSAGFRLYHGYFHRHRRRSCGSLSAPVDFSERKSARKEKRAVQINRANLTGMMFQLFLRY